MEYMLLDVGMGGAIVLLGGAIIVIFVILAFVIAFLSIRAVRKEIKKNKEAEAFKAEDKDEEI